MKTNESSKKDLIIFSNGPGEVATWVLPVVEEVQKREELSSIFRIILIIQPCPFGSGAEGDVATEFEGVEAVIMPGEYVKILFTGIGKKKYRFRREGLIFSLGGDLMHPVLFRRRIKGNHKLYAYTKNPGWGKHYERIFVRNDYVKNKMTDNGISPKNLTVTGDLVYSSLKYTRARDEVREEIRVQKNEKVVIFLAGSRDFEVRYMMPVFLKVIADLTRRLKEIKPFFLKSPYITYDFIEKAVANGDRIKIVETISGKLKRSADGDKPYIEYEGDKKVHILERGLDYWGQGVDFAVTIPGTNTIQLAYRKIPSLVVAPLNKPELYPVEGIFGLLKWVPVLGKMILKKAVFRYLKQFPFASLPNMYANEEIFPELFKVLQTDEITEKIIKIFENGTDKQIVNKLERFKPDSDPVDLIISKAFAQGKV
jgi:lipid-A-disaccharide synthase